MKIVLIVLDSAGVGALPDAEKYNDVGANTLGTIAKSVKDFNLANLAKLGLYNLLPYPLSSTQRPLIGSYGKMTEASNGKDTSIGHWEITGIITKKSLPTYQNGFPRDLIEKFEHAIGKKTIGNYASSGTEIIKALGDEHCKTGYPIVYTSADSVLQIAAHEDEKIFGLKRLYEICKVARKLLVEPDNIGRVIARPFIGTSGNYKRTPHRHDYSLSPPGETLLDKIVKSGGEVIGIGKVADIFNNKGISKKITTKNNQDGMRKTLEAVRSSEFIVHGNNEPRTTSYKLIFTNLVDFDMLWGHRRDIRSYYDGLKEFDDFLPKLKGAMSDGDVLFITADHGCDPGYTNHTDHTREYVPLLVFGKRIKKGVNLGTRKTFSDLGQTVADFLGIEALANGISFRKDIS